MENKTDNAILKQISLEIEKKHNCKVLSISFAEFLSLCVYVKIQFNEDFLYKPFANLPTPDTICFSEKAMTYYRRVDLFECIKKQKQFN